MTQNTAATDEIIENADIAKMMAAEMITVQMRLRTKGHELALAVPRPEWLKLVSDFMKMPADERQRVGVSIREAVVDDPFPVDGSPVTPAMQHKCDVFVNDCILLAALAETVGSRIMLDTAVETYKVVSGLPQMAARKGKMN